MTFPPQSGKRDADLERRLRMLIDEHARHVDEMAAERDLRYQQRFEAAERAVKAALEAADKAVGKAEITADKWRENANEWRGAMNDRERSLMPRSEAETLVSSLRKETEQQIAALSDKIALLLSSMHESEGRNESHVQLWALLLGVGTLLMAGAAIVVAVTR